MRKKQFPPVTASSVTAAASATASGLVRRNYINLLKVSLTDSERELLGETLLHRHLLHTAMASALRGMFAPDSNWLETETDYPPGWEVPACCTSYNYDGVQVRQRELPWPVLDAAAPHFQCCLLAANHTTEC